MRGEVLLGNSSLPAIPKVEKCLYFFDVKKICNSVDFNHNYTRSYMININTFQAGVPLPVEFQNNKVVTKNNTYKTSNKSLLALVLPIVNLMSW